MDPKDAALEFLRLIVARREEEAFSLHVGPGFVHHNPFSRGGAEALKRGMIEGGAAAPGLALEVVHLFRFEKGRIVEFWDVAQAVPRDMANEAGMF
jgi:predicted SnoaL-like aldol condensation-catalyzing enzyme